MSAMTRRCLNDDLKKAIDKLDYLSMSVGEALCRYFQADSLTEVATLNWSEQNALLNVGTAVASLFNWRESAVHQEMRQLFMLAANGSCAGNFSDLDASKADALDDTTEKHASRHPSSAKGNAHAKGPHWNLVSARETDPAVKRQMTALESAMNYKLISEKCVDKVLYALWESHQLAIASTSSAAVAVAEMDKVFMPSALGDSKQAAQDLPSAFVCGLPVELTDSEAAAPAAGFGRKNQRPVCGLPVEQMDSESAAAAAAGPSRKQRALPSLLVAKAAKRAVRDVFLWTAAGEMGGFDSRDAFDIILGRCKFSIETRAQLGNGLKHNSGSLGIKTFKPKRNRKQAEEPDVAAQCGMPSDTDDRDYFSEHVPLSSSIRPPPGLEGFCEM